MITPRPAAAAVVGAHLNPGSTEVTPDPWLPAGSQRLANPQIYTNLVRALILTMTLSFNLNPNPSR